MISAAPTNRTPHSWLTPTIPIFAPREEAERAADPYDRDFNIVDLYTGLAYGHLLFHEGAAEGLYRTMASLLLSQPQAQAVLDIGCGPARMIYDCAPILHQTQFTAVDFSYHMCLRADQLIHGDQPIPLPVWNRRGRPDTTFEHARQLDNACIVQASAQDLPFAPLSFDVVTATLVLCRLADPFQGLAEMVRVLRPQGQLLLATPLGFQSSEHWRQFADGHSMRQLLLSLGFRIDQWFDGLRYREVIDANHNAHEWNVRVVAATLML